MNDYQKTREELITELEELRQKYVSQQNSLDGSLASRNEKEDALHSTEQMLRIIADNAYNWEFWEGADGHWIHHSPSCKRITGYSADQFLEDHELMLKILHPDDKQLFLEHHLEVEMNHSQGTVSFRIINKDGEIRHIDHVCQAVFDENNFYIGLRGSNIDVTDMKLAKDRLRFTQFAIDHLHDPVYWMNSKGKFIYVNDAGCQSLGYTQAELLTMSIPDIDPVYPFEKWEENWQKLRECKQQVVESVHKTKMGTFYPVEIHDNFMVIEGQEYNCVFAKNISERKRAESILAENQELLSLSQQIAHVGSWSLDGKTNHITWTDEVYRIFGFEPQELVVTLELFYAAIHPDDRKRVKDAFTDSIIKGFNGFEIEHRILHHQSGDIRFIYERYVHERDHEGTILRTVGMVQDITEQVNASEEVRWRNEDLLLMNSIIRAANNKEELTDIINLIGDQLKKTFNSHLLSVFIPDAERCELKMYQNNLDFELVQKIEKLIGRAIPQISIRMDEEHPFSEIQESKRGLVFAGKEAVLNRLTGYLQGTPWPFILKKLVKKSLPVLIDLLEYQSCAAVPLTSNGTIVGFLELGSRNKLTSFDLNRLQSIADQLAAVIIKYDSEKRLRESEERMSSAFTYASNGIAFVSPSGRWLKVNPAISEIFGYTEEEMLSKTFQDLTHPDDLSKDLDLVNKMLKGTIQTYQLEKRYFHKSGRIIWILLNVSLVRDPEGKPLHFISQLNDITIRKQAEDAIKESEKRFRTLYENMVQGVVYQDRKGTIVDANPAAEKILGLSIEQLKGHSSLDPMWNTIREDGTPFPRNMHPAMISLRTGKTAKAIMGVFNAVVGQYRWINVSANPEFRNGENTPYLVFTTFDDITALKNTFNELEQAKAILEFKVEERTRDLSKVNIFQKAILDNAPIAIFTTDIKGILQSINPAGEEMTGYSAVEVVGKVTPLHFLYKDENLSKWKTKTGIPDPREEDVFVQVMQDMLHKTTEWTWVKKIGQKFTAKISLRSLINADGNLVGYLGLIMDVTKEREYLESLIESETVNRAILQAVPDLLFRIRRDGTYLDSHTQNDSSLYLPKNLFLGRKINEVLPTDLAQQSMQAIENAFAADSLQQYEYVLSVQGVDHYFENRIIPISDTEALSIVRDITDRRKLYHELVEERRRLAEIIKGTNVGTWEWNIQTGETVFNERWAEMIGYTLLELSPVSIETWMRLAHPDDLKISNDLLDKHLNGLLNHYSCESRIQHKNGEWIWVLDQGRVHKWDSDGKPLLMAGTHIDITENKRASEFEAELLQLSLQLTGIPVSEIPPAIDMALGKIGSYMGANRAYVFEMNPSKRNMNNTYIWKSKEMKAESVDVQNILWNTLPMWMATLMRQENIVIPSVAKLPLSWQEERNILDSHGILSIVVIPMMLENMLIGFVGLDWITSEKEYKKSEISMLQVLGNMLASLINHQRKESYIELMRLNYETFFNTIDDFLFVLDTQGNIIHTNNTVCRRLGYEAAEMEGQPVLMVHPAARREEAARLVGEMLMGKTAFCPVPLITKSGDFIPVETRVKHGFWDENPVIFGVSKDISKIELSEEKFSKAFQSNAALMAISNLEGRFLEVNETFIKALGYERDEVIGYTSHDLNLFDNPGLRVKLNELLLENIAVRDIEVKARTKSGDELFGLFSGDLITIGEEKRLLTMMVDITHRKLAEAEIIKAKSEAEKANLAKSEFLSRMSHELRTPMNSILGFAQLLEMGDLNPKQKKGVSHILNNGKHLLALINEVLDISGIEARKQTIVLEPVQLKSILGEITDTVHLAASKRNVSIEFADSLSSGLHILADQLRLKQVLLNLLDNAIKYNNEGGLVTIKTTTFRDDSNDDTKVRIAFIDTGNGIKAEDIGKLFQPFERIGADKTETEGTGLGLMLVKKITEAMNGRVGIESTVGFGSTFWIELPIAKESRDVTQTSVPTQSINLPPLTKPTTILYIEDNLSNIAVVEDILHGHRPQIQIRHTAYGKQALNLAKEHNPDLILLDLDLPDINGSEVLNQLLTDDQIKTIPVIIISANAMPLQIDRIMKAGATDYLTKPLDVRQFLQTIDENLNSHTFTKSNT